MSGLRCGTSQHSPSHEGPTDFMDGPVTLTTQERQLHELRSSRTTGSEPALIPCKKHIPTQKLKPTRWKAHTGILSHVKPGMWDFPTIFSLQETEAAYEQLDLSNSLMCKSKDL